MQESTGSSGVGVPTKPLRIAAIDDHPMLLRGLGSVLHEVAPDLSLVDVAPTVQTLLAGPGQRVDVVLLDLHLADGPQVWSPERNVTTLVETGAAVLIYTSEERPVPLRRAIAAGASGVLLKIDPIEAVVHALRTVGGGDVVCSGPVAQALLFNDLVRLSPREIEIIEAISDGLPAEAIAATLFITEGTVREHLRRAFRKFRDAGLEVRNAHGLVREARSHGYLD